MVQNCKRHYFLVKLVSIFITILIFIAPTNVQAIQDNLDLSSAQTSVGKRFAKVFCDAKKEGLDSEFASEYALNNTYLKFVAFPDDEKFIEDLWEFTIKKIRKDCGNYVTKSEEINLRDFFQEEGEIASNRDLYLPD